MAQLTAKTREEVRDWVENTPHHAGGWENDGFEYFYLKGHGEKLRIPLAVKEQVKLRPGDEFDNRMFRFDGFVEASNA